MGRVTKTTPTKVTNVITAVTKIRVMVTRMLVEDTNGKTPVGVNTTHPRGDPPRLPIQRDKIKV